MVGHGGIVAFDDRTDMRELARHLLHFGTSESCGKCFPCRIGLRRALEMVETEGAVDRTRAGGAAGDARGRQPVRARRRHAGADPQPDQAFSGRAGGELGMEVFVDGVPVEVEPGTTALEAAKLADRWVPTLCLDDRMAPFGACRVCLVEIEGGRGPVASCTTVCRDGMQIQTQAERARRIAANVVSLVLSELPVAPAPHTELAQVAARLGVTEARWTGITHTARSRRPPPLSGVPARALHLVRPVRARVRRDSGGVCAHRHRARLPLERHRRPRFGLRGFGVRLVRRVRRHLPDRRDLRAAARENGDGGRRLHSELRWRINTRPTTGGFPTSPTRLRRVPGAPPAVP